MLILGTAVLMGLAAVRYKLKGYIDGLPDDDQSGD
jgi:hypothetical protein